jgi:carbon monoxide dehydrogenase subunit G
MKIEQRFAAPFPRATVWAFFRDPTAVVPCLPGAELTELHEDGTIIGRLAVKLGPIQAGFAGTGEIRYDDAGFAGELSGTGNDRKSGTRAKGTAQFALAATDEASTEVAITVDYTLSGALAQFNRGGIVQDLAARLTAAFAANLAAALTARQGAEPAPPTVTAPLDAGSLIGGVVRDRVRGWLQRKPEEPE